MPHPFCFDSQDPKKVCQLDVRADDTDTRDYIFEPSLALLPDTLYPEGPLAIRHQGNEGACVGHALAAVINISVGRRLEPALAGPGAASQKRKAALSDDQAVSERMLYEMGRRYDEWQGEHYQGTSLRGAMKGWHKHGVCSRTLWPYVPGDPKPGRLDSDRARDARRRPLGTYFRILDSDVSHVQAAIYEGDAVLASANIHSGWQSDRLRAPDNPLKPGMLNIMRIPQETRSLGLHAFALIGYGPEGFIVQNSWGEGWGTGGLAILSYEDWFINRQDAWVARPGPQTWDYSGKPRIFLGAFAGAETATDAGMAGTTGVEGLNIEREALAYMINTGDRGELSQDGRLETSQASLPEMAARVLLTPVKENGFRDVVLYAHGGLVSEGSAVQTAARLWRFCRDRNPKLTAYFFVWESGFTESFLGNLLSQDDAQGPRTGFDPASFFHGLGDIAEHLKKRAERLKQEAANVKAELQKDAGKHLADFARVLWQEMKRRAAGAAVPDRGGAALFLTELFKVMASAAGPAKEPFRLHLVGHSAGSIFLGQLYRAFLKARLQAQDNVQLGSIQFMAPAISIKEARRIFAPAKSLPVPSGLFRIYTLLPEREKADSIIIYPHSVLTYIANCLERRPGKREPLLGIASDLEKELPNLGAPRHIKAELSHRHIEFDDPGHEVEQILDDIARM